jgi:hypothetical protein
MKPSNDQSFVSAQVHVIEGIEVQLLPRTLSFDAGAEFIKGVAHFYQTDVHKCHMLWN